VVQSVVGKSLRLAAGMVIGGMSYRQTAERFNVSHSIIVRLKQRVNQTGNVNKMHWTPQYTKKAQITLIVSNVSITSIDGKNFTSSEDLLGGVILGVHSSALV
jgi:hypothetical protein